MNRKQVKPNWAYWLRIASIGSILLLFGTSATAQKDTTRILFVGNSFTYFYNLPQVVSSMGMTQDIVLETRQSTVGGTNLEQHWKGEKGTITREMIDNQNWDYVVLNNHSRSSIDRPERFMKYGKKFVELIRSRGAEPVFMMTWAYKSNPLMQPEITRMYQKLCQETQTEYVPCGPLFAEVRKWRPDLQMFFDDKHPSSNGTYLLGLAFFKYFTQKSTANIPKRLTTQDINGEKLYLIFMQQTDAAFLQQLVDEFEFKTN